MITRTQWAARAPRSTQGMSNVLGVAVHWEGVGLGNYDHSTCPGRIRAIQNFHMDGNKWADIAYNMIVCRHGEVFEGRGAERRSAANGTNDGNARYYAICVLMGPGDTFTMEAKRGVLAAREHLMARGGAGRNIVPHRSFLSTQCPGPDAVAWILAGCPVDGAPIQPAPAPAPPAPSPNGDPYSVEAEVAALPTVRQGSTGQHVRIMQGLLVANGRGVSVDGDFGPGTYAALAEWQGKCGLDADGICGPRTWRRLLCI